MDARVHAVFDTLREDINKQLIKIFQERREMKPVTKEKEEGRALAQIKRSLDTAEREIRKESEKKE